MILIAMLILVAVVAYAQKEAVTLVRTYVHYAPSTIPDWLHVLSSIDKMGYRTVKEFQKANGLKDDGIIGPRTKIKLQDLLQEKGIKYGVAKAIRCPLKINIQTDKQDYDVGEPIKLEFNITNIGDRPVKITRALIGKEQTGKKNAESQFIASFISFSGCSQDGNRISRIGGVIPLKIDNNIVLSAGQSYRNISTPFKFDKTTSARIQGFINLSVEDGWIGKLTSNVVAIKVEPKSKSK